MLTPRRRAHYRGLPASERKVKRQPRPVLTADDIRFVEEYALDLDATAAAGRANIPLAAAAKMMTSKVIQAAIQIAKQRRSTRTEIYADDILCRWWQVANVDAREYTQIRRVNCRQCWGREHQYQFRDPELFEAEARHNAAEEAKAATRERYVPVVFNNLGGPGFDGYADPCRGPKATERLRGMGVEAQPTSDHDCPACDGMGEVSVWVNDSRNYSTAAAKAFEGVKVSKDGTVEVKIIDREHAWDTITAHVIGTPIQRNINVNLDPTKLTDEQLAEAIKQFGYLAESRERGPLLEHSPQGGGAASAR